MNNQTPEQFLTTLYTLANAPTQEKPEFVFMAALKHELLENGFDRDTAQRLAGQPDIALPPGATTEQLQDMGYHYANLIAKCHDDLVRYCGFDGPSDEAALFAQRLVRQALA
jgi:hypothetical protein